tara:strand:- start:117 stop:296 length:180 start_codon:yes stop_codon:yes gene_type:complete
MKLKDIENAVYDIQNDFNDGAIPPQSHKVQESRRTTYIRGATDALDMLVRHFKEINDAK